MKEYHKIETLWKFDNKTHKFYRDNFFNKNVELLKDNKWIFTEKIDGTNFRLYWDGHTLSYAGRTDRANFSKYQVDFINENICNDYFETSIEQLFKDKEVYIFGELFGNKIQKGGHLYTNNEGLDFRVFDIMVNDIYLTYDNMINVAEGLGFKYVPKVLEGTIAEAINYVETHDISTFSNAELEGLVGKPIGDFKDRLGKRIVVKIKRKDLNNSI